MTRSYRTAHGRPGSSGGRRLAAALAGSLGDLRMAARTLGRQPMLLAATVLPVALAIAANTALFSFTDGLLFRELRLVRDPGSLVAIGFDPELSTYISLNQLRAAVEAARRAPALTNRIWTRPGRLFGDEAAVGGTSVIEQAVSLDFFDVLGVQLAHGRGFFESDLAGTDAPAVVVAHDLWRIHLGADATVPDGPITLAGQRVRVVGIAPPGFAFPDQSNVWAAAAFDVPRAPGPRAPGPALPTYARIAGGVGLDVVRAQLPQPLRVRPLVDAVRPRGAMAVAFLFGTTALLLLVSWLQVGALLFTRSVSRSAEIGIRLALGAGRARLFRGFAAEAVVVAGLALMLAWLATPWFVVAVVGILPPDLTAGHPVGPDLRALVFASAMTGAGILALALLPVDLLRRVSPLTLLKGGAKDFSVSWSAGRVRSAILLGQVTVTVVLLYVAGLVAHSFVRVTTFDLGFDSAPLIAWTVPPAFPADAHVPRPGGSAAEALAAADQARRRQQIRQHGLLMSALDALRTLPEISAAAAATYHPVTRNQTRIPLSVSGHLDGPPIGTRINRVTPEFFDTLGMRVVEGDAANALRQAFDVVVINEALAARIGRLGTVVGQRIQAPGLLPEARIVGVVADYVDEAPDLRPDPQVFLPTPPERAASLSIGLVRATGDLEAARGRVRAVVAATWGDVASTTFTTMDDEVARATVAWRGRAIFVLLIAVLCLPLAVAGLFGALNYDIARRSKEIAVRLALGADPGRVRRQVTGHALALVAVGIAAGVGAGWLVGRLMEGYLFGIAAADFATSAAVAGIMLVTAWLAALAPAWRASRTDPAGVLREA
jgi:predicted permease